MAKQENNVYELEKGDTTTLCAHGHPSEQSVSEGISEANLEEMLDAICNGTVLHEYDKVLRQYKIQAVTKQVVEENIRK